MTTRNDAAGVFYTYRTFQAIAAEVMEVPLAKLKSTQFIPVDSTTVSPCDTSFKYYVMDGFGKAELRKNCSTDAPLVDVEAEAFTRPLEAYHVAFSWCDCEDRLDSEHGRSLVREKARKAREVIERKLDRIAAIGDSEVGIGGLLTDSNVATIPPPSGGNWISSAADADTIIADIMAMVNSVQASTKCIEMVDTILLPCEEYNYMLQQRIDGTGLPLPMYFRQLSESFGGFTVAPWWILDDFDADGLPARNRAVAYKRDPSVLKNMIAQDVQFSEPEKYFDNFKVLVKAKTGGTIIMRPGAVIYMDGI